MHLDVLMYINTLKSKTEHGEALKLLETEMAEHISMPMCPMAETCKGMMGKSMSGFMLIIPAVVFILLGAAVLIEPRILVWLVAAALIVMGIVMLMVVMFMRKIEKRFRA